MVDFVRGMKAGACAGVASGAISNIAVLVVSIPSYYSYGVLVVSSIVGGAFYGIVLGLFFGLIFAAAYDKIPGDISSVKGVMFSVLFWLFFIFIPMIFLSSFTGTIGFSNILIIALLTFSLFGFFAGFFYDMFKPTKTYVQSQIPVRRCSACGRVIPSDSMICPYCGYKFKETVE